MKWALKTEDVKQFKTKRCESNVQGWKRSTLTLISRVPARLNATVVAKKRIRSGSSRIPAQRLFRLVVNKALGERQYTCVGAGNHCC